MKKDNKFTRLVLALLALLISSCQAEQGKIEDYETARPLVWSQVYAEGGNTLYCHQPFGARRGRGINVEHLFPMSWVAYSLKCGKRWQCRKGSERFNRIEADLHNLYPSRTDINKARSNFRFGNVPGEGRSFGSCDFEIDERQRIAEPRPAVRGEIARSMLYMHQEYGLYLKPGLGRMLVQWHLQDPPSKEERRRNAIIEKLQGNRNRYIDQPELARKLRF